MKYIIYSRVSTVNQDVAMQNQKCFEWAQREGGTDITLLSEDDLSTSIPMHLRPALQQMLGILTKKVTIVIYSIDRLARDNLELLLIRNQIESKGARLFSCNEGDNEMTLDMAGVWAKHEKKRTIQRTKDKLAEKQRRMERVGRVWYGYTLDESKLQLHKEKAKSYGRPYLLIPHAEEQRNIAIMVDLKAKGYGLLGICNHLTAMGYMSRSGKPFQLASISRILYRAENGSSPPRKSYRKYH